KWIAAIVGWYFAGILGAIIAYSIVSRYTRRLTTDISFEIALLRICSMIIKSDGNIESIEVETVRNYFKRAFGFERTNRIFKEAKVSPIRDYSLNQLVQVIKDKLIPSKFYSILQFLYYVSSSDGKITKGEDEIIYLVGSQLGFTVERINAIRSQFINSSSVASDDKLEYYLNILGLKKSATADEIKTAYRSLAKEFHPDKLSGMSKGIKDMAKEKFQLIQEANEYLQKNYI
ncbi:DnaJ domain-containing protein, partial [Bacteroidota bacterium]|nr:DnaJ domain-containing protein [Bacteroidota bacterium]